MESKRNGNNGIRVCCAPTLPKVVIKVVKTFDEWSVKEVFFQENGNGKKSFEIVVTRPLQKFECKFKIEAIDLDGYRGNTEDLRTLPRCSFLRDYHTWKNREGVSLFNWLFALAEGSYLKPTSLELNGGKSDYEVSKELARVQFRRYSGKA